MRTKVEWRSASKTNYKDFRKSYPDIKLSFDEWKDIVYGYNESFRDYILEIGDITRLPNGFGEFTIAKEKKEAIVQEKGRMYVTLPVNWPKTREKGKIIYHLNYETDGFIFSWRWIKPKGPIIRYAKLWKFVPCRVTKRLIKHYLSVNDKYQHLYRELKR